MPDSDNSPVVAFQSPLSIGDAVGVALRHHRIAAGLAIRDLGKAAGVSSAMISRIENGQVSPSLSTLEALANALSVPVMSFFQHTVKTADINFVKVGDGISAKRFAPDHVHDYKMLANFQNNRLKFTAAEVSLDRKDNGTHPVYFAQGYVLITPVSGACIYSCGGTDFDLGPGDCLSFDAQLRHGVKTVTSKRVTFITISAMPA